MLATQRTTVETFERRRLKVAIPVASGVVDSDGDKFLKGVTFTIVDQNTSRRSRAFFSRKKTYLHVCLQPRWCCFLHKVRPLTHTCLRQSEKDEQKRSNDEYRKRLFPSSLEFFEHMVVSLQKLSVTDRSCVKCCAAILCSHLDNLAKHVFEQCRKTCGARTQQVASIILYFVEMATGNLV